MAGPSGLAQGAARSRGHDLSSRKPVSLESRQPLRQTFNVLGQLPQLLDEVLEAHPVLVRISAAKRLRDAAERGARHAGETRVTSDFVDKARSALMDGVSA